MSVTKAKGFVASGVAAGLKASGGMDVALVVNTGPEYSAGLVTTSNRVFAAPVKWTREAFDGTFKAVVLNSGGANAATGPAGYEQSKETATHVAREIGCESKDVAVCSTGLIGELLPIDQLLRGVREAATSLSVDGGEAAAHAILTTDTRTKLAAVSRNGFTVGGMGKGAGMLAPAMATMLVVITTDASLGEDAQSYLEAAVEQSFHRIDSDGAMSTNDTVVLLASGASGVVPDPEHFASALGEVTKSLARQLIADAEGASHDILIRVVGASSTDAALAVARAVSRSNLFKAAIFGNDPNWGRVIAQVGTVPENVAPFEAEKLDVWFNGVHVCRAGGVGDDRSLVDLAAEREVVIEIDLHAGDESVELWTNDLTHDYVHENSAYSS